jgi:hypothetical protein
VGSDGEVEIAVPILRFARAFHQREPGGRGRVGGRPGGAGADTIDRGKYSTGFAGTLSESTQARGII